MADIKLINLSNIQNSVVEEFCEKIAINAHLPDGKLLLLIYDKLLRPETLDGYCYLNGYDPIPDELSPSNLNDIGTGIEPCNIVISKKAMGFFNDCPAFCRYLISHEFGHAKLALSDPGLFGFGLMLNLLFASEFQRNEIEDPHEIMMEKFAIYISEKIMEVNSLKDDIKNLILTKRRIDKTRLGKVLDWDGSDDFSELGQDSVKFARENETDLRNKIFNLQLVNHPLVKHIKDLDKLFDLNEW